MLAQLRTLNAMVSTVSGKRYKGIDALIILLIGSETYKQKYSSIKKSVGTISFSGQVVRMQPANEDTKETKKPAANAQTHKKQSRKRAAVDPADEFEYETLDPAPKRQKGNGSSTTGESSMA